MLIAGSVTFWLIDHFDHMKAYQFSISAVIFIGALLMEVPTTQQRFIGILQKLVRFMIRKQDFLLDSRRAIIQKRREEKKDERGTTGNAGSL